MSAYRRGGVSLKNRKKRQGRIQGGEPQLSSKAIPEVPLELEAPQRKAVWWLALGLIAVCLIVYAPVRHYGYVDFDDREYVTENPSISGGLTPAGLYWALTTDHGGLWMPLTWASYMLDIELFGPAPGAQHVTNAVLHVLSTLLLFAFLVRVTGRRWPSVFVAALFAIHPLHVESVTWIAERKDVLSGLFWMLALWLYVGYVRQPALHRYVFVVLSFALALMCKPMVVTLPFVLLLLDVWPLQRIRLESGQRPVLLRAVAEKLPLVALAAVCGFLTIVLHKSRGGIIEFGAVPMTERVTNAVYSYVAYLGAMIWPSNLAPFYPYEAVPGALAAASFVLLAVISVFVVRHARAHPFLPVGWFWYLGTLVPVIGLLQVGMQARADRFTYLPMIGVAVMAAWGIPQLARRLRHHKLVLCVAGALAVAALTTAARVQVKHWESRRALWGRTLEVTEDNYVAHSLLALALVDRGRVDEALAHYQTALSIQPEFAQARNNLGIALAHKGRMTEAVSEFRKAISLAGGKRADMYYNLGFALAEQGYFDEAIRQYSEAVRINHTYPAAHTKIGDALQLQGRVIESLPHYTEALRIQPNFTMAHNNLAAALAGLNRHQEAIFHYDTALRLQPRFAEAHNGLGSLLANLGRYDEAIAHFRSAVQIQPAFESAQENLEIALEARRSGSQSLTSGTSGNSIN
jgi:tetratricopeptide (TPR) repeat protein